MTTMQKLNNYFLGGASRLGLCVLALCTPLALISKTSNAAEAYDSEMANFATLPFDPSNIARKPMVMLNMSRDHQLFFKAYSDYEDINNDSSKTIDNNYNDGTVYYGYFDARRCYLYDTANGGFFYPVRNTVSSNSGKCNTSGTDSNQRSWSGNFLNWASMTRIDVVRKVLYGGYRSVDTTTETVLERSHLPNDAHSFAKYLQGDDVDDLTPYTNRNSDGITICNTSIVSIDSIATPSQLANTTPKIRVARGNNSLWAANERFQCLLWNNAGFPNGVNLQEIMFAEYNNYGNNAPDNSSVYSSLGWNIFTNSPNKTSETDGDDRYLNDFTARVKTCVAISGDYEDKCAAYSTARKPEGLLQQYGKNDAILFGLMTGSYNKNKDGGVLRKHISSIRNEIDSTTGQILVPATGGIIKTLDTFKITGWIKRADNDHNYWGSYLKSGDCGNNWGDKAAGYNSGECTSWGNPFGEILLESYRYFSGETSPTAAYNTSDTGSNLFNNNPNLPQLTWTSNPFRPTVEASAESEYACSVNTVLAFNASTVTHDNNISTLTIGGSSVDVSALTNEIGRREGLGGNNRYFIGSNGSDGSSAYHKVCSPKTISDLSQVHGTCPDAPSTEGSFKMAGLAYHANINDVNPGRGFTGKQTVQTLGVSLAPALPTINVPAPGAAGTAVRIIPACRNSNVGGTGTTGSCALVDFKVLKDQQVESDGTITGEYIVVWEDIEQAADFDQDMLGLIRYRMSANGASISVETKILSENTDDPLGFGFVITGVSEPNFYALSGTSRRDPSNPPSATDTLGRAYDDCPTLGLSNSAKQTCQTIKNNVSGSRTFTVDRTTLASDLNQPLYYAARWGSFKDSNDNTIPDAGEWDSNNYTSVNNPSNLENVLTKLFAKIIGGARTATGGISTANSVDGTGITLQSYYESEKKDNDNNTVSWVGHLNAFWSDGSGDFIEDTDQNGQLTAADNAIRIVSENGTPLVKRFRRSSTEPTEIIESDIKLRQLSTLKPIWSARNALANVSNTNTQGAYKTTAGSQRYIFTARELQSTGNFSKAVGSSPFTAETFNGVNDPSEDTGLINHVNLLGLNNRTEAAAVVNYLRGDDSNTSMRKRSIRFTDNDTVTNVWRLGDIVNARPLLVAGAVDRYDLVFNDATHRAYREWSKNRRHMVYAPANDGFIHAFNAGFFDLPNKQYLRSTGTNTTEGPALGAEFWAYAPYNLLPQLKFLTSKNYSHVFYIDGQPQAFDVKIFPAVAPRQGWGTILVVPMRLGGGAMAVDNDANPNTAPQNLRSAFVVFDITDPEEPPRLLGEFSHADLGYTTTNFAISRKSDTQFSLVFGSGPTAKNFTSTQAAKMFELDLSLNTNNQIAATALKEIALNETNAYVSGVTTEDWNRNRFHEVSYASVVSATGGNVKRVLDGTTTSVSNLFATASFGSQTFAHAPVTLLSNQGEPWVITATGRTFTDADMTNQTGAIIGMKEEFDTNGMKTTAVGLTDLYNATGLGFNAQGEVTQIPGSTNTETTRAAIRQTVKDKRGWYSSLTQNERAIHTPQVLNGRVLYTVTYKPGGIADCKIRGFSDRMFLDFTSGAPVPTLNDLNTDGTYTPRPNEKVAVLVENLGPPIAPAPPTPCVGTKCQTSGISNTDLTTGPPIDLEINFTPGRQSWRDMNAN
jgi:type IV pilus assembly protein PilY1